MSLRSDPNINPEKPDPVTRNQPDMERTNTDDRAGSEGMPGNYPVSPKDSTSSGGYGASSDDVWSQKSQRGVNLPTGNEGKNQQGSDAGLIDQATDGTDLTEELRDAVQGEDKGTIQQEDEWGVEKGADKDF